MSAIAIWAFAAGWLILLSIYAATIAAALLQPFLSARNATSVSIPFVSIIVPLCEVEPELSENLDRLFDQDYPNFEIALSFARGDDPAIEFARSAMLRWPRVKSVLRIGESREFIDLKVRNEFKCLTDASSGYVYIVDSNIALPRSALRRSMAQMTGPVGLVAMPPVAVRPLNFVGHLETAFINGYAARFLLAGSAIGLDLTFGKTMLVRWSEQIQRSVIAQLKLIAVEDAAILFGVRRLGLRAQFSGLTVDHPVGARSWRSFWGRHLRWAMYRRAYYGPVLYLEMAVSLFPTLVLAALGAAAFSLDVASAVAGTVALWFGLEGLLHLHKRWVISWLTPFAWIVRELLLPWVWLHAVFRRQVKWNDQYVQI
jgi:ceramide glucosyltransferase